MDIKAGKIVLECAAVNETKRYLKYRLPAELFEDEEPEVLFSGRHIYLLKGNENATVKQVVIVLKAGSEGKVTG